MPNIAAFLSYVVVTAFTPGPNTIMCMTNASRHGFRRGFRFCLGVTLGCFLIMIGCAAFSTALYWVVPKVQPVMQFTGAAYILWLAWKIFRDKPRQQEGPQAQPISLLSGLFLQFVNPKLFLYGLGSFANFISPYYTGLPALAGFVFLLTGTAFLAACAWSLFGSLFQRAFVLHGRLINAVMSLLLVYCAVSILIV